MRLLRGVVELAWSLELLAAVDRVASFGAGETWDPVGVTEPEGAIEVPGWVDDEAGLSLTWVVG